MSEFDTKELLLSSGKLGEIGREYLKQCRIEDFESQLVQSDITTDLTEDQYHSLIEDPSIPERIEKTLGKNDSYWDSYWHSISEVIGDLTKKYHEGGEANV